jgi:hypothetical protein
MPSELANNNANRAYAMATTSIAIFTFMLVFLFPRYEAGQLNPLLFEGALVVMGLATFASVLASVHYYGALLDDRFDDDQRRALGRRADLLWSVGYSLLFLAPVLILFAVGLLVVGAIWAVLWGTYMLFALRNFSNLRTPAKRTDARRP